MIKIKTDIKTDLKNLIISLDYLTPVQKDEWVKICENLNYEQMVSLHKTFLEDKRAEENFKVSLIYRTSLGGLYKSKLKDISSKYMTMVRKKSEAFAVQTEEKPEDILNKLNDA